MFNVLLVEDDKHIREAVCDFFSEKAKDDINIFAACDGYEAENMFYENQYDLVLLDIMLPGVDGFTLCRSFRKESTVPIIFLTAKASEEDVLFGYETGCDDYVIKPFSIAELLAKVRALLRRSKGMVGADDIVCGDIALNPFKYLVKVRGVELVLAPKEYMLLRYLMERKNNVVDRDTLLSSIWGYDFEGSDRVVDNHIKKLRKALGPAKRQIKTVVSKGYKIVERGD